MIRYTIGLKKRTNVIICSVLSPQLNSIADCTMAEIDEDKDGFISYDEFCKAMDGIKIDEKMSIRFL